MQVVRVHAFEEGARQGQVGDDHVGGVFVTVFQRNANSPAGTQIAPSQTKVIVAP